MTECIHGLETAMCDVCSPRQTPERPKVSRAGSGAGRAQKAAAPPAGPSQLKVNRAEERVYLVVARDRLGEVLPTLADAEWRSDLGSATDPFRWPDATVVERPSDLVVLVATFSGELQLVAVANEPARRATRDVLTAAGVDVRIVLQPAWWV